MHSHSHPHADGVSTSLSRKTRPSRKCITTGFRATGVAQPAPARKSQTPPPPVVEHVYPKRVHLFAAAVREMFQHLPESTALRIASSATKPKSGRVGTLSSLQMPEAVLLAVAAHAAPRTYWSDFQNCCTPVSGAGMRFASAMVRAGTQRRLAHLIEAIAGVQVLLRTQLLGLAPLRRMAESCSAVQ